uniref:Aminopeptidase n=1 Tax=Plectus sambesii TaxID=2011161 RepID=A0A914WDA4_9BILA
MSTASAKLLAGEDFASDDDLVNDWPSGANQRLENEDASVVPPVRLRLASSKPNRKRQRLHRISSCTAFVFASMACFLGIFLGLLLVLAANEKCNTQLHNDSSISVAEKRVKNISSECPTYPWPELRLPTSVEPVKYTLTIRPNLTTFVSTGNVDIDLNINSRTDLIVLHAHGLNVTSYQITVDGTHINAQKENCEFLGQLAFKLSNAVNQGEKVQLSIRFVGQVSDDLVGLYKNTHYSSDGSKSYSAVTQFEPTDARKMFPCFDEPAFKAVFQVSIERERRHTSKANMALQKTDIVDGQIEVDHFAPSVKMSTYLVAIAVFDFANVTEMTKHTTHPIRVSIHANQDMIKGKADLALETAIKGLEYLETFFKVPFPLEKQDLLALDDFAEGAMENWGLITFRDSLLLYDQNRSTTRSKEMIATVVVHELAHQWFGNLVTMKWWNDLWLNEGFANFIEYFVTDRIFPDWKLMDQFYVENLLPGLFLDGMTTSHAISVPVHDPAEIGGIFDAISYQKGASIIRMFMGLSGEEPFKLGLQEYLEHYKYQNAEGSDLWEILQKHIPSMGDVSLIDVATAWTTQVGYPLVQARLENSGTTLVIFNQTRFLSLIDERTDDRMAHKWPIPIIYKTDSTMQSKTVWMKGNNGRNLNVILPTPAKWVIANADGSGFYRVLYDQAIYHELAKQLKLDHTALSAVDRAAVLYDAFSFVKSGHLRLETLMNLLAYLESGKETDRAPWVVVLGQLRQIEDLIEDPDMIDTFQAYERRLVAATYSNLGWELTESHSDRQLQAEMVAFVCRLELQDCVQSALIRFSDWLVDNSS